MLSNIFSRLKRYIPVLAILLIVLLGFLLRAWKIDSAPKGALIDELHFGYLAKSLLETGADEHGNKWPLVFEGFGDEKLPAMAYLDMPSVAVFGLSLLAIRIPSLIAGTLLIIAVYWLFLELEFGRKLALLGAFITAVSPWPFFLSRFGFESNLALLFFTLGLALIFKMLKSDRPIWRILAGISFGLTWYSYIAYRPITIVIILAVAATLYLRAKLKKTNLIFFAAFAITVLPLFSPNIVGVNNTRFDQVGITSDPAVSLVIDEKRAFCSMQFPASVCYLAANKPVHIFRELSKRYLMSFSPDFLVSIGETDNDFLTVNGFGQFFPVLYPFFILGLAALILRKDKNLSLTAKSVIIAGLLLAPIPAALVGEPQKVRISAFFPFVLLTIIYGIRVVSTYLDKSLHKNLFYGAISLFVIGYSFIYFTEYFGVHVVQNEYRYQSYLPELHQYLQTLPEETLVNLKPFYSDPLMFYAFYTDMDPELYQELAVLDSADGANFRHTVELDQITAYKTSIENQGCKGIIAGLPSVYVTNESIDGAKILYQGKATNDVHTYVYAYDAALYMENRVCKD